MNSFKKKKDESIWWHNLSKNPEKIEKAREKEVNCVVTPRRA
jgi:hypothetical protein